MRHALNLIFHATVRSTQALNLFCHTTSIVHMPSIPVPMRRVFLDVRSAPIVMLQLSLAILSAPSSIFLRRRQSSAHLQTQKTNQAFNKTLLAVPFRGPCFACARLWSTEDKGFYPFAVLSQPNLAFIIRARSGPVSVSVSKSSSESSSFSIRETGIQRHLRPAVILGVITTRFVFAVV